jgi:hypothetical protein
MPFLNQHSGRVKNPELFKNDSFRSKDIAPGVRLIMGKLKGNDAMTAQAYRFDSKKFTKNQAEKWLKDHDVKPILFEEAEESMQKAKDIEKKVIEYLTNNPAPRDEKQFHKFAETVAKEHGTAEEAVYRILGAFLSGGKSKGKKEQVDPDELAMGIKVELEHTPDKLIAEKIARDHLAEFPDYYSRLKKMESEAEKTMTKAFYKVSDTIYIRLEKARVTKYIKRIPKPSGKGYYYFYNQQQVRDYKEKGIVPKDQKPEKERKGIMGAWSALADFFGITGNRGSDETAFRSKINDEYSKHKDKLAGVDISSFAYHLNEFLANKEKWLAKLSKEPGEKKEPAAEKKEPAEKKEKVEGAEKKPGQKWNMSLMRAIAGIYGGKKTTNAEEFKKKSQESVDRIKGLKSEKMVQFKGEPDMQYHVVDSWTEDGKKVYRVVPDDSIDDYRKTQDVAKREAMSDVVEADEMEDSKDNFETMPEAPTKTADEYAAIAKKEMEKRGSPFTDSIKESLLNQHYNEIKDHIKAGGKISEEVFMSLEKPQRDFLLQQYDRRAEGNFFDGKDKTGITSGEGEEKTKPISDISIGDIVTVKYYGKEIDVPVRRMDKQTSEWKGQKTDFSKVYILPPDRKDEPGAEIAYDVKDIISAKVPSNKSAVPEGFQVDLNKMKSVKLPKEIKAKGIDSKEYREWVRKNWAKDSGDKSAVMTVPKELNILADVIKKEPDIDKSFNIINNMTGLPKETTDKFFELFREDEKGRTRTPKEGWKAFVDMVNQSSESPLKAAADELEKKVGGGEKTVTPFGEYTPLKATDFSNIEKHVNSNDVSDREKIGDRYYDIGKKEKIDPENIKGGFETGGFRFVVIKKPDSRFPFKVIEEKTGLDVSGIEKTMKGAVESAKAQLERMGKEKLAESINSYETPDEKRKRIEKEVAEEGVARSKEEKENRAKAVKEEKEKNGNIYAPNAKKLTYGGLNKSNFEDPAESKVFEALKSRNMIVDNRINPVFDFSRDGQDAGVWTDSRMLIMDKKVADEIYNTNKQREFLRLKKQGKTDEQAIGDIAEKTKDGKFPNYQQVIPSEDRISKTESKFTGEYHKAEDKDKPNILKYNDGETETYLNADYVATIKNKFPDAKMYSTGQMSPMVFKVGNEIKAVLMPMQSGNREYTKLEKASELDRGTAEEAEHKATVKFIADYIKKNGNLPSNKEIYESIAKDHLSEIPDYYSRLSKMESQAKMEKAKAAALLLSELKKGREAPVGTLSPDGMRKKMADGKWLPVPGAKRKAAPDVSVNTKTKTGTVTEKKKDQQPIKKEPGKPEDKKEEKKGLTDDNKNTIKNTLKKVASILADALSGRDSVTPTGQAVEQAGDTISEKGKKKKLETTRPGAQPPDKKPETNK